MRRALIVLVLAALPLAACNRNTALGNDRQAGLDAAPTPAPIVPAAQALENVAPALIKPETMSGADLASLGPLAGKCAVRLTEVGFPSFVFAPGSEGTIKLNGKLIRMPASGGPLDYREGGLAVTLSMGNEEGDAGLSEINMIVVPPGAKDEIGYSGFRDCNLGDDA